MARQSKTAKMRTALPPAVQKRLERQTELLIHPFPKTVREHFGPLLGAVADRTVKEKFGKQEDLAKIRSITPAGRRALQYFSDFHPYLQGIIDAVRRLCDVPEYLSDFPKKFSTRGISEEKWILYNYSNYIVTLVGIYDTALLLTNAVFVLGLDPKDCKDDTVLNNKWVKRTKVKAALKNLDDCIKPYRQPRNLYVHRSFTPEYEELENIRARELLAIVKKVLEQDESHLKSHTETESQQFFSARWSLKKLLDTETDKLTEALKTFFDALQPVYDSVLSRLDTIAVYDVQEA